MGITCKNAFEIKWASQYHRQLEETPDENKAKAMVFLRHHLHDCLKNEYITKEDPADLWQSLKDRFDHQKYVILPKAKHDWLNLRFLDYKCVGEYNSAMFGITSRMMLCGENVSDYDTIKKTLSTFHPGNVILQEQYRAKGYTRYSELMQVLKNFQINEGGRSMKKPNENVCYRCGMKGHWKRICRTPKHFVDLYQESQKKKARSVETNFVNDEAGPSFSGLNDDTHLDGAYFPEFGNVIEKQND